MKQSLFFLFILLISFTAFGQDSDAAGDAAKKAQNPLANIISLPFQNNTDFGYGEYDRAVNTLNIQPILPASLGKNGWIMINRFIIPFPKSVPDFETESGNYTTGLGDINYTLWFAPPTKDKLTYGFGAVTIWPTGTSDELGQGKLSIGPSIVLVYSNPKWLGAAVVSDWFSVAGDKNRPDVSAFYLQYIFSYFLPQKWYLTTGPINLANWEAEKGQRWTVPVGGGGGKMFSAGKLPMDAQVQAFYYAVKTDGGPTWQLRLQLKMIFPTGKK